MSVESTQKVMQKYFDAEHGDSSTLAEDVIFTIMGTGEEHRGRDAVRGMLHYFYNVAFDAKAEARNMVIGDGKAVGEWDFVGTHKGEFAGVPATGKQVRVPLCVAYDLENNKIVRARVYFEIPAFLAQVGVELGSGD